MDANHNTASALIRARLTHPVRVCLLEGCEPGRPIGEAQTGLVKISDIGIVFLVLTLTAFVPGACSFPGRARGRGEGRCGHRGEFCAR
jgi:hypothetical protein